MNETRELLEQVGGRFAFPEEAFERLQRRRDRKSRNRRISATVVAIVAFAAVVFAIARPIFLDETLPATPEPTPSADVARSETFVLEEKPGIYVVDVRSGEATPLPESITDIARPGWDESGFQASADGSQLLFMGEDEAGRSQVYLAVIDGSCLRQLTHEPVGADPASMSADGSKIVYVALSGTNRSDLPADLVVMDVSTGETTVIAHADRGNGEFGRNEFQYPRFAPDGRTILFTSGANGYDLYTIPVTGGEPTPLLEDGYDAVYSPDGATIAFHRDVDVCLAMCHGGTSESQIWLADADGGDPRFFGGVPTSAPRWSPDGTRIAFGRTIRSDGTIAGEPIGSTGPGSESPVGGTVVFDPATGDFTTIVNAYALFGWVDDHRVIVQIST